MNEKPKSKRLICRKNLNDRHPYCMKKPCYLMCTGECEGPIVAEERYYSYYNCPDEPDTGGKAMCGTHVECSYCRDYRGQ